MANLNVMTPSPGVELPLDKIAEICRKYSVREMGIFGSAARGEATSESDIDILLDFLPDSGMSLFRLDDLNRELEEVLGRRVDLASKRGLKKRVRPHVMHDLRIVYEA
ncbi:MAG: nucleotidyltransferase family protein [Bryobacterales bacterium]|nr:nucleotidyltransferase family protein [Bryobacterales bacterium]MBV9397168.1 nucleotidyltransferase family protein [Bryobacterales bacterium]